MTNKEFEALWQDAAISREEAKEILAEAFMREAENMVEEVRKDSPRMFTKFLKNQNEQFKKLFKI